MMFYLILGPCVIEDEKVMYETAEFITRFSVLEDVELYYKTSIIKDNRSNFTSYTGTDFENGIQLLNRIKKCYKLNTTTDFHDIIEVAEYGNKVDLVQIPAFLSMQTRLVFNAIEYCKKVNVKKAQFITGKTIINKLNSLSSILKEKVLVTERGNMFGNNDLVLDIRNIIEISQSTFPCIIDAGHVVRKYGIPSSDSNGGQKQYIENIALTGILNGATGLFLEVHPKPQEALCDAATQVGFETAERIINKSLDLYYKINSWKT
jgi:2-dehydro-3-deoxyphosphooctonate aldolase (KDO 8-P synthase)